MANKNILIVEDERVIAMDIQMRLERMGYQVCGTVTHFDQVIETVSGRKPDLVLMDIRIQGEKDGIDTALVIYEHYQIPVVFLTAHGDTATFKLSLKARPFGFLTKPFKDEDLKNAIELALTNFQISIPRPEHRHPDFLFVKDYSRLTKIRLEDILWIEAMDNYSSIVIRDKKIVANAYLSELELRLPSDRFIRIHRSYIVSMDKMDRIEDDSIFIGEKYFPIGRSYRKEVLNRINII